MTCSHSDEADAEIPSISSRSREVVDLRSSLPTRVRRACERCRQHKSRCDPFRPCSLCVRANVPCRPLSTSQPGQGSARTRMKSKQVSRGRRKQTGFPLENSDEQSRDAARSSGRNAPTPARTQSPEIPSTRDQFEESSRTDGMTPSLACGEAESAIGIARRLCELGSHHIDEQTTFAIPGCQTTGPSGNLFNSAPTGQRVSITVILGQTFPPMGLVYNLVEEYFHSVHWFSLAIFEPKFRSKLHSIKDGCAYPSQRPFLLLLAVMLGMAAWYRSRRSETDLTDDGEDWERWSADMMKLVESNVVELMDQPSVTATQTCILLGSHHVYHGRPNLSFSLLGATIKMAQSIGLQRQCLRGNPEDIEERKRVWWTIYTWDRFASITYGRPLGINDKDCNLQMPSDVLENPSFASSGFPQDEAICYSTYQRELNRLYWIASPALEAIFGSRTFGTSEQLAGDSYFALVKHATKKLEQWRSCLPSHLSLDLEKDVLPDGPASSRAYALQSLSLQLTYDNILIVLHRPLLARQVHNLSNMGKRSPDQSVHSATTTHSAHHSGPNFDPAFSETRVTSPELWVDAAVRTSKITELPVLVRLATESHLVAFLAINLFHAAIVLAVLALSQPLSDTAQDVKRTITRIFRVQDLIGKRSALSKQSTLILRNVVALLLRRESEAMLAPFTGTTESTSHQALRNGPDSFPFSVEDALRLPADATLNSRQSLAMNDELYDVNPLHRLNESLASVQHALGPGDDRFFGTPPSGNILPGHESIEQSGDSNGVWQPPAQGWDVPESIQSASLGNSYDGNMEGGIYWLWDMTWNAADR